MSQFRRRCQFCGRRHGEEGLCGRSSPLTQAELLGWGAMFAVVFAVAITVAVMVARANR